MELVGAQEEQEEEGEEEGVEEGEEGEEDRGKEEGGGGNGGRGVKEEHPEENIQEVKAETVEVAVEDAGGGGDLVATRNVLTLAWVHGGCTVGTPPMPPFLRRPAWRMSPCTEHFAVCCGTTSRKRVRGGGGWRNTGGAWTWKPLPGKPLSPIPEPIGSNDLAQAEAFTGPHGTFMRGSHCKLCFHHCEEKRWVRLQRLGRKLEGIPQWQSNFRGVYDSR